MNTPIIALALAVAPTSYTPRVPFDVSDVEVESGDNSSHVVTYDAEGEVSANIVIWAAPSGVVHLDADFAGKTLVAGGGCATGIALVCVGLTFLAVCECLPLLSSGEAECY